MNSNELYYQTAKDTILYQSALHTEFSARAFNLFNIGLAALVAVGFVVNARLGSFEWTPWLIGLGVAFIVGFVWVSALCLWVLRTRDWYAYPPLNELAKEIERPSGRVRLLIADYMKDGAQENEDVLASKARALFWAILGLTVEIVSLISVVILVFWGTKIDLAGGALTVLTR